MAEELYENPLALVEFAEEMSWVDWRKAFDNALSSKVVSRDWLMHLIHCGFAASCANVDEEVSRMKLYLVLSVSHDLGYLPYKAGESAEEERMRNWRISVAKKAWHTLANRFFEPMTARPGDLTAFVKFGHHQGFWRVICPYFTQRRATGARAIEWVLTGRGDHHDKKIFEGLKFMATSAWTGNWREDKPDWLVQASLGILRELGELQSILASIPTRWEFRKTHQCALDWLEREALLDRDSLLPGSPPKEMGGLLLWGSKPAQVYVLLREMLAHLDKWRSRE